MTNIVSCTRCEKVMINEEYNNHICMPEIKSFKTIKFTDYYITKNKNGTTIHVITKSGLDLELIEVPENKEFTKIPYQPKVTARRSTEDETAPDKQ